jgi:hypothetical protein
MVIQMYCGRLLPQNLLDERHEKTLISLKRILFVKKTSFSKIFNIKNPDDCVPGSIMFCAENQIKKVNVSSPFLPQIYHKLNLLMLWWVKCIVVVHCHKIYQVNYHKNRL